MKKLLLTLVGVICSLSMFSAVTDLKFTAVKTIAGGGEIWYPTATNVAAANGAGWCSNNTNGSNNKYANITPSLSGDETAEDAFKVDGVLVKGGNIPGDLTTAKKAIVIKVKNTTAITAYGATTSSSAAAGLQWSIYEQTSSGYTAVVSSGKGTAAAPNNTATISKDGLSADKTYIVCIEGGFKGTDGETVGTSTQDVVVYAMKFEAPSSGKASSTFALTSPASVVIAKGATSQIETSNNAGTVTYASTATGVATVSETGLITAVAPGTANITVTDPGSATVEAGSAAVSVVVPYEATTADSYLLNSDQYGFSGTDNTYYFKNGLTISNPNGKTYGTASLAKSLKYSAGVNYSINIPDGVTIYYAKITARNNYDTGNAAANWGTIFGQDFTTEELPYSSEGAVEKTVTLAEPQTGGSLVFIPGGNQVQMIIELFTSPAKTPSDLAVASATASVNKNETTTVAYTTTSTGEVTVKSDKENIATATVNGNDIEITGVAAGEATITVSQAADDTYAEGSKTITVTVTDPYAPIAIFTAKATADATITAGAVDAVITDYATINGGTMTVSNGQTKDMKLVTASAFSITNNNTVFKVVLDTPLQAGDIISADVTEHKDTQGLGLWFSSTSSVRPVETTAATAGTTATDNDGKKTENLSYTVEEGDSICGATTFYIFRAAGKTTYFQNFTISRPVTVTVAAPTITAAAFDFEKKNTAVTIASTDEGATLYYSYDNNTWTQYTEALKLTAQKTIYAKASVEGLEDSEVATLTAGENFNPYLPFLAVVYQTNYNNYTQSAQLMKSAFEQLVSNCNLILVAAPNYSTAWTELCPTLPKADIVLISEAMSGGRTFSNGLKELVGQTNVIHLKAYNYTSGRWSWGAPGQASAQTVIDIIPTSKNYKLFDGCTFNANGGIDMFGSEYFASDKNHIQSVKLTDETVIANSTVLAYTGDSEENVTMHTMGNNYLFLGISCDNFAATNANFLQIMKNAAAMMLFKQDLNALNPAEVTISSVGYSTFAPDHAVTIPSDVEAYIVKTAPTADCISLTSITGDIAAGEGIIIKGEAGAKVSFVAAASAEKNTENLLVGTVKPAELAEESAYILANQDGKAVFSLCTAGTIAAGKAYLPNTTASAARTLQFVTDNANSIKNAVESKIQKSGAYNLAGQKVGADYKGIVIENGVKVIKK